MREMVDPATTDARKVELCASLARLALRGNALFYGGLDSLDRATVGLAVIKRLEAGEDATLHPPGKRAVNKIAPGLANSGHLIAKVFGGHNRYDNLVAQERAFNQYRVWNYIERPIRDHLKKGGCAVCYIAIPRYKPNRPAPDSITFITIFTGAVEGAPVLMTHLVAPPMEGDYSAEAEPWNGIGLGLFGNAKGPVN